MSIQLTRMVSIRLLNNELILNETCQKLDNIEINYRIE